MAKEPPAKRANKQNDAAKDIDNALCEKCPNSRMTEQDCKDLAKKFGGKTNGKAFTKSSEGNPQNTKFAHSPGGASGVTLGYGYDLKHRTKKEVYKALIDAGVNEKDAKKLSDGVKLTNQDTKNFVSRNDIAKIALTEDQKNKLFDVTYKKYKDDVKRLNAKIDVQEKYGYTPWEKLKPAIQDILIDLHYRGDYGPNTRKFLQKHVANNNLSEFTKAICNPDNWKSVPKDRRERRCNYAKWKEQCESSQNKQKNREKSINKIMDNKNCNSKTPSNEQETSTVYRVDEKKHPRMIIDDGNVEIPIVKTRKGRERELFINVNQLKRAKTFQRKRVNQGKPAEIKAVEVDNEFIDKLKQEAVLEQDLADFPDRPVKVDLPTPDQFGLKTSEQIEDFRKSIKQGSGKVVDQD
jgi:hypothetical protein